MERKQTTMLVRLLMFLLATRVMAESDYRLPRTTFPIKYVISLDVDPRPGDFFSGVVNIFGVTREDTSSIVLHAVNMTMSHIRVLRNAIDLYLSHTHASDDTNFLTITLSKELSAGDKFIVELVYQGVYGHLRNGLFRDSYEDDSGKTRYLLGTQMQPTFARQVYPCYDEPDHKATFDIDIKCPSAYHVVSNGELMLSKQVDGVHNKYIFKTTPKMSSYLVAFVVSEFDHVSNYDNGEELHYRKEFRCFAQPEKREALRFSLDYGQRVLAFLEDYTNVTFAMDKMDNAGIPSFAGGMENWGLVIYGEYLLAERINEVGQVINRRSIEEIMSHEFTHMWFGDEVTPEWWSNLWLSEGFATFFEYYATSYIKPDWKSMNKFVTYQLQQALKFDSKTSAKSMNHIPSTPTEIEDKFNYVSYAKAGSVIRMMFHVLGENTFQESLRRYLKRLPKGSTIPEYLYDAMQSVASESVEAVLPDDATMDEIMGSWADQRGYPLISVQRTADKNVFDVFQSRYLTQNYNRMLDLELFWVPLNWVTQNNLDFSDTSPQAWMPPERHMTLTVEDPGAFIIFNKQQTGFYRIMYDVENWLAIGEALHENARQIHELNRAQIIDDALEFTISGHLPIGTSMKMVMYLAEETDLTPWNAAEKVLRRLKIWMRDSDQHLNFERLVVKLNQKRLNELGFVEREDDDYLTKVNRLKAIHLACDFNSSECSSQKFEWSLKTALNTPILGALMRSELKALPSNKAINTWKDLWKKFTQTRDSNTRTLLLVAMSYVPDENLLRRYIKSTAEKYVRSYEISALIDGVISSNYDGARFVLEFINDNLNVLKKKLGNESGLSIIFETLTDYITSESQVQMVETMRDRWGSNLSGKEQDDMGMMLEASRANMRWMKVGRPELENWLKENVE